MRRVVMENEFDDLLSPSERRRKRARERADELAALMLITHQSKAEVLTLTRAEKEALGRAARRMYGK
jgi:hypothetical protein